VRFRRRKEEALELQLLPLIDVVFLLLIFFLMGTTFIELLDKLDIQLPPSKVASRQERRNNLLEMSATGEIYLNGASVSMDELERSLERISRGKGSKTVVIKADRRVSHGDVVQVMGQCQKVGLLDIAIAALLEVTEEVGTEPRHGP
jgi:biopolymer transport protein ExbD